MKTHFKLPIVKLPVEVQEVLFLIREELKSQKLFDALHQAGLDDCYFQPSLDLLITRSIGLDDSDETFAIYDDLVEKRSRKIVADNESVMKQAFKVYHELLSLKKKLSRQNQ